MSDNSQINSQIGCDLKHWGDITLEALEDGSVIDLIPL